MESGTVRATPRAETLFGSSGIRRVMGRELVLIALEAGLAVGQTCRNIIIGSDTRTSGEVLKSAFTAGALAAGAKTYDAGITPTPTLALAARRFDAGVMVTASHNPPEYNGLKLFNPDGSAFGADQRKQVAEAILNTAARTAPWREVSTSTLYEGAVEQHIDHILADFPEPCRLRVVVDAGCGAAFRTTPALLTRMGAEIVTLGCYPSGFFPRNVEPTEASLSLLMKTVRESGASLGVAHDGDADRMMAVDERGRFISGDKLMAILASDVGAHDIVTTVDASMAIEEMGFRVTRTRVGDVYVSDQLKIGGDWGGEPSGSWIFPTVSFCPDGIYAAARLVNIARQRKLSELADSLPQYPVLRGSFGRNGMQLDELKEGLLQMKQPFQDYADGLKLDFAEGWLLVRFSGTEPKVRLTAEAREEAQVYKIYESGVRAIAGCIEKKGGH